MDKMFKFTKKESIIVGQIIDDLGDLPRKGYKDRGVLNPETVWEHTIAAMNLGSEIFPRICGLRKMLFIHDWPERKCGDQRTDPLCSDEERKTPEEKYLEELEAMTEICSQLERNGAEILSLWLEFEENNTRRAKIAKQIDRAQTIIKSLAYEKSGEPVIAQEFIDYYGPSITCEKIKAKIKKSSKS